MTVQYASGNTNQQYQHGESLSTPRASALLSNGQYFTKKPPTYQEYTASQIINIKSVADYVVYGDGVHDDTLSINIILEQYAESHVIYFPAGTYIVTNTILIPVGSRIYGDAYASAISALGPNFYNPDSPTAMVRVGNANDVGIAQINDMLFTVADVLQGCTLVRLPHIC